MFSNTSLAVGCTGVGVLGTSLEVHWSDGHILKELITYRYFVLQSDVQT